MFSFAGIRSFLLTCSSSRHGTIPGSKPIVFPTHGSSLYKLELLLYGKIAQIPAFFENVIVRPVGSLTSSGSSTLKRVKCRIRISVDFCLQSSI